MRRRARRTMSRGGGGGSRKGGAHAYINPTELEYSYSRYSPRVLGFMALGCWGIAFLGH